MDRRTEKRFSYPKVAPTKELKREEKVTCSPPPLPSTPIRAESMPGSERCTENGPDLHNDH